MFRKKYAHKIATLTYIFKTNDTVLETLLVSFQVCHSSIGRVLTENVAPKKHR